MTTRDSLPLPDFDQLPAGAVATRVRALDPVGVEELLSYEQAHANRPQIVLMLEHRLAELNHGATPTGGSPGAVVPERADGPAGSSSVGPQTSGPPINPPAHGVPTNPAQPRT